MSLLIIIISLVNVVVIIISAEQRSVRLLNHNETLPSVGSVTPVPISPSPSAYSNAEAQYLYVPNEQINHVHVEPYQISRLIKEKETDGWLVASICAYTLYNETVYAINYARKTAPTRQRVFTNLTVEQLESISAEMTEARFDPINICSSKTNEQKRSFSAIWHKTDSYLFHYIIELELIQSCIKADVHNANENYYAHLFEVFTNEGLEYCIGIWKKSRTSIQYRIQTGTDLKLMQEQMKNFEMTVSRVSAMRTTDTGQLVFYIIWLGVAFSWLNHEIPITTTSTTSRWRSRRQNHQSSLDHYRINSLLDQQIEQMMLFEEIPSLSISVITEKGVQISKSYGYADIRQLRNATPYSKYRTASISKVLTAMAIQRLLDRGLLKTIDVRVFGDGSILGHKFDHADHANTSHRNQFMNLITVKHLLEHTVGAWGNQERLEYERRETNRTEFFKWLLQTHPLRYPPGRRHLYSNIGYMFLGRVIEALSGQTYETFVSAEILEPLNISARIGRRQHQQRQQYEVSYYSPDNANPYFNWDPERMDSAAGWVLTASQIAKIMFELAEERNVGKYALLWEHSERRLNYGRGLQLVPKSSDIAYHYGSMAGTEAIAYCAPNFGLGIVINTRGARENHLTGWMQRVANFLRTHFRDM